MTMSGASSGGLGPAGWKCDEDGEMKNEEQWCKDDAQIAHFKHSQSLEAEDVWRMKVVAGGNAISGIAAEGYDVERHGETSKSTAVLDRQLEPPASSCCAFFCVGGKESLSPPSAAPAPRTDAGALDWPGYT